MCQAIPCYLETHQLLLDLVGACKGKSILVHDTKNFDAPKPNLRLKLFARPYARVRAYKAFSFRILSAEEDKRTSSSPIFLPLSSSMNIGVVASRTGRSGW